MDTRLRRLAARVGATLFFVIFALGACCWSVPTAAQEKAQENLPASAADEEAQRLLAERERQRGPTFPGKDPAFLVLPRTMERTNMARDLLTPEVQVMSGKALEYIVQKQDADGGWSDTEYTSNTGVTALACMALMAQGSRPRAGKYGRELDRGLSFLLANAKSSGLIAGQGSNPMGPCYEHAFSTLALLMAYGDMPWRPEMRDTISKALQLLDRSQKRDGGWRFQMSREGLSDLPVTTNVLLVLRTAKKAGFTVRAESIAQGVAFVESCSQPDGYFRYRFHGIEATPSLSGAAIVALTFDGQASHPLIAPAREKIVYEYQRYKVADFADRRFVNYNMMYASMAMYSSGDAYWIPWFQKAAQILAATQRADGEWADQKENIVYPTAMSAILLQAPQGYLPLYER